jgi:hypothetical protein
MGMKPVNMRGALAALKALIGGFLVVAPLTLVLGAAVGPTPAGAYPVTFGITGVAPATGPDRGTTPVTITGVDLTGTTSVLSGTVPGTSVHDVSPTTVTVTTPAHTFGAVTVSLDADAGTTQKTAAFTFVTNPTVTGVTPPSGRSSTRTPVTISGTQFTGATSVTFGTSPATTVVVTAPTQITALTPVHLPGVVAVRVTNAAGSGTAWAFTYETTPISCPNRNLSSNLRHRSKQQVR